MWLVPKPKEPSMEEIAAFAILEAAITHGQGQYVEMEALASPLISFTNSDTRGNIQTTNYVLGRSFCLQHNWLTAHGNRYAVTSHGRQDFTNYQAGKYYGPGVSPGSNLLEHLKGRALQNKLIVAIVVVFLIAATATTFLNNIIDLLNKLQGKVAKSQVGAEAINKSLNSENQKPDITLKLVHRNSPAVLFINNSDTVAHEIKWSAALWNIDHSEKVMQPLPIPVRTFDWIRAREEGGPQALFDVMPDNNVLKIGDRVYGSISVSCPDCTRGVTYIVFFQWGKDGWYSQFEGENQGRLIVPKKFTQEGIFVYSKDIESLVPINKRIKISE